LYLARAYAAVGRYAEAADTLLLIRGENIVSRRSIEAAALLLRSAPMKTAGPETLPALQGELNFVYAYVGALDRIMEFPERLLELNYIANAGTRNLWLPEFAPLRKTERFKALMRKSGILAYWRERGWADLCHPTTADNFECD